jgi:hypothetical protein
MGCEATLKPATSLCQEYRIRRFTTAAQPSGSKLPRHRSVFGRHFFAAPPIPAASTSLPDTCSQTLIFPVCIRFIGTTCLCASCLLIRMLRNEC